jgi:hypothetical protein
MTLWYFLLLQFYTSINGDKHSRNNCHWNYWLNRHDCHSDYWSNRKYHRVIHSYNSINGNKYCRNTCHCNYWHHCHSDYWSNRKYHRLWMALWYFLLLLKSE